MSKGRLEAFTDGVMAILITLMVLDLPMPKGALWSNLFAQRQHFLIYFLSFFLVAIYWNNHHHIFSIVDKIDGFVLWANNLVILFLSFFPFITSWVSEYPFAQAPQMTYGLVIFVENLAFWLLGYTLVRANGKKSRIGKLFGSYRKLQITIVLNVVALLVGLVFPVGVILVDSVVMIYWILPERQIEKSYHKN